MVFYWLLNASFIILLVVGLDVFFLYKLIETIIKNKW